MHLSRVGLLALAAAAVDAFRDTSPFFLASTSELLANSAYIKTSASLFDDLSSSLSSCPSDYYVVVHQPGVHSSDFSTRKSAPRLGAKMMGKDKSIRSQMSVNEVAGLLDVKEIKNILQEKCKAETTAIDGSSWARIVPASCPIMMASSPISLTVFPPKSKYTLLYVTSPREFPESDSVIYESDGAGSSYLDPIHMDLKRDYSSYKSDSSDSESDRRISLFDEYQFFTPGIFMGLIATFFFVTILYIGVSALSSLQVPYAAFEKDTSAAAKKQQ
ncbi:hypothetical protein N7533_008805 [Penicillium manginii]|uniref:uncharacterized protein n=1 Tax=Penicillium manginii TaxID=203109 RepID=UPI0025493F90|nr:uncharacterized protein N7533_008805 [Penicillium manginii]KAJ5743935.1 hypothetical protein N7533_008805 [Penicillium manginii]